LVVVVKLAGRAAEPVVVGAPTAGAGGEGQSDLAAATSLLAALRASYGLYDQLVWRAPPEAASAVVNRDPALRRKIEADLARLYRQALRSAARAPPPLRRRDSTHRGGVTDPLDRRGVGKPIRIATRQ
jgi:hypothetical protein